MFIDATQFISFARSAGILDSSVCALIVENNTHILILTTSYDDVGMNEWRCERVQVKLSF